MNVPQWAAAWDQSPNVLCCCWTSQECAYQSLGRCTARIPCSLWHPQEGRMMGSLRRRGADVAVSTVWPSFSLHLRKCDRWQDHETLARRKMVVGHGARHILLYGTVLSTPYSRLFSKHACPSCWGIHILRLMNLLLRLIACPRLHDWLSCAMLLLRA